jgi:hypothetical protein
LWKAHIFTVNTATVTRNALQLNWGSPTRSNIAFSDEFLFLVNPAVADLSYHGATQMPARATRSGRRLTDPTTSSLLL